MIAPARIAAYQALRAVSSGAADLPHALARARADLHDERDRALAGEIVTGALRWQAAFDYIVTQFARRPIEKLDPEILDIRGCRFSSSFISIGSRRPLPSTMRSASPVTPAKRARRLL
jgi:hypothetical protein